MNIVGIICEYDPFHAGHAAHIANTRALSPEDSAVVCVMSGNFVQRGMPAVFPKQLRTEAALRCGADLVIELPAPWSVSSAGRFAVGGVSLLAGMGLPFTLSFGSECGDAAALTRVAQALSSPAADELIRASLDSGTAYAAAMQSAADTLLGDEAKLLRTPNNLLGIEYIKAAAALGAEMTPLTIPRIGAEHNGAPSHGIASASHLRTLLRSGECIDSFVPAEAAELYKTALASGLYAASLPESAVLYRLRTMTDGEYAALPDGSEGLWSRLAKYARTESSLEAVIEKTKTKRYARSRVARMVLWAYLGVTDALRSGLPPYIRVLGANARGREVLAAIRKTAALPVITKPASARKLPVGERSVFEFEARCSDLYALCLAYPNAQGGAEWKSGPVIL